MEKTIFVVDDMNTNLVAAEQALEQYYNVITIPSGKKALAMLERIIPHLILLDIHMPEMNGFEVLEQLKASKKYRDIPVMLITGMSEVDLEVKGFEMGVVDFVKKPFSEPVLVNRVKLHIDLHQLLYERTLKLTQAVQNRIYILASIVEQRNRPVGGHIERVAKFVEILVKAMLEKGVYPEETKDWDPKEIARCAILHDIGNIRITDTILTKPDKLTLEEFEIVKTHTSAGAHIIDQVMARDGDSTFMHHAKMFALYHHELWNGKGYPYGLAGTDIPIHGRIMALVDAYDNYIVTKLTKEFPRKQIVVEMIMQESGNLFDPKIVEVFNLVKKQFEAVKVESDGDRSY